MKLFIVFISACLLGLARAQSAKQFVCPNMAMGYVADPAACDKFYLCLNGFAISQTCPSTHHFSRTELTCVVGTCTNQGQGGQNQGGIGGLDGQNQGGLGGQNQGGIGGQNQGGLGGQNQGGIGGQNQGGIGGQNQGGIGGQNQGGIGGQNQGGIGGQNQGGIGGQNQGGTGGQNQGGLGGQNQGGTGGQNQGGTGGQNQVTARPDPGCPSDGIYLYPITGSCTTYRQCFLGVSTVRTCGDGLQFDSRISQCNLENNVKCLVNPCPEKDIPGQPIIVQDPANCSGFYVCLHGDLFAQSCPIGTLFQRITNRCEMASSVNC